MTTNIAEQLLRGSENIDRMKKEIDTTVQMICGLINTVLFPPLMSSYDYSSEPTKVGISFGKVGWEIWIRPMENKRVYAFVNYPGGSCGSGVLYSIPLIHVGLVHESLTQFVNSAVEKFSGLEFALKPLLDAADKFPPTK